MCKVEKRRAKILERLHKCTARKRKMETPPECTAQNLSLPKCDAKQQKTTVQRQQKHQDEYMDRQNTETRKDVEKHKAQHAARQYKVSKDRRQMSTEHIPHNMPGDSIPQDISTECPSKQGTAHVQRKSSNRGNHHTTDRRGHTDNDFIARQNLETFRENTVEVYNVGKTSQSCSAHGALMFTGENSKGRSTKTNLNATFSLCCRYGAIKLPPISDPPYLLQELLTGNAQKV